MSGLTWGTVYCIYAWSSTHTIKDIDVENVHSKTGNELCWWYEIKRHTYEERLKLLKLTVLERKRERGDLIEEFKILTGREDVAPSRLFQLALKDLNLCGHHLKLYKSHVDLMSENITFRRE